MNSYSEIVELGSGELEIDALTGDCKFEGRAIDQLIIAGALCSWLNDDLATHSIDPSKLLGASVLAKLKLSTITSKKRVTSDYHMGRDGRPIALGQFYRLEIRCNSEVATDEKVYSSEYNDIEEFPHGWPAA
tara:strand:- start:36 stop:431 length:396 start_codon:yes stop_codon:yes gene_type:complete